MYFFHAFNPVVVVEFNQTIYFVDEDAGFVCITVVSDIPAPANFCDPVFFTDITATGECIYVRTYVQCTYMCYITFGKDTQGMDQSIPCLLPKGYINNTYSN